GIGRRRGGDGGDPRPPLPRPAVTLVDELRGCFLFEKLTDDQLAWLVDHGTVGTYEAGTDIYREGDPSEWFFVLLEGDVQVVKRAAGEEVAVARSSTPGAYAGATRAFVRSVEERTYDNSLRALARCRMFQLRAEDFAYLLWEWFPMATHLLDGLFLGLTNIEAVTSQREKLMALGSLSAGLAHELNNPAASGVLASHALRARLDDARESLRRAVATIPREAVELIVGLEAEAEERARTFSGTTLRALEAGDREDELADWLEDHGID